MKKIKSIVSLALAGLMLAAAPCADAENVTTLPSNILGYVVGDVNRDGKVTVGDALEVLQASVGMKTLSNYDGTIYMQGETSFESDANGDGQLSVVDALEVLQISVGLKEKDNLTVEPDFLYSTVKKPINNKFTMITPVIIKTYEQYLRSSVYQARGKEYNENFFNSDNLVCFIDPINTSLKAEVFGVKSNGKNVLIQYKHREETGVPSRDMLCVEVSKSLMYEQAEFCEVRLWEDYSNENGGMNYQTLETSVKKVTDEEVSAKAIIRSKAELDVFLSQNAANADFKNTMAGRYFGILSDKFFESNVLLLSINVGINSGDDMDDRVENVEVNDKTAVVTVRLAERGENNPSARYSAKMTAVELPKDKIAGCTDYVINYVASQQQESE